MILVKRNNVAASNIWVWVLIAISVLIAAIAFYAFTLDKTMLGAERAELLANWLGWKEAGSPAGTDFDSWRSGRRPDLIQHTNTYYMDGVAHKGALALRDPKISGILVVTTNGSVILVDQRGRCKVIR